jgi:acylphosphatase
MHAVRLRISGRVQGVGYRTWALQTARRLDLRGWVRNRADGTVEALVVGGEPAVAAMIEACRRGPRTAAVEDVAVSEVEDDGSADFTARSSV